MSFKFEHLTFDELEARLRKAAAAWFKNDDLLALEELIRRAKNARKRLEQIGRDAVEFQPDGSPK